MKDAWKWVFAVTALLVVFLGIVTLVRAVFFPPFSNQPPYEEWLAENRHRLDHESGDPVSDRFLGVWESETKRRLRIVRMDGQLHLLRMGGRKVRSKAAMKGPDPLVYLQTEDETPVVFGKRRTKSVRERLALKLRDTDILDLDHICVFTDDTDRQDFFLKTRYRRVVGAAR